MSIDLDLRADLDTDLPPTLDEQIRAALYGEERATDGAPRTLDDELFVPQQRPARGRRGNGHARRAHALRSRH